MNDVFLNGKSVEIAGSNAVNNVKALYPALFQYNSWINSFSIKFPNAIQISLTNIRDEDTDYYSLEAGQFFAMSEISIFNLKIKSATAQTGYIFTAGI